MKVVYTAPNRAHHYRYALALHAAGCLHAFVSGFPRISPRSKAPELDGKLHRLDFLQTIYLASLKLHTPPHISNWLAYRSKIEQDFGCRRFVKNCDVFLFYNGSGLNSCRYARNRGAVTIVEAVNTHLEYQEEILKTEHLHTGVSWKPFPKSEKKRRLLEYETADYILMPSDFVKRSFIEKGFPESKLLKVPYGFSKLAKADLNLSANSDESSFNVLYVGSISLRKGIRYMIEAFKMLKHPNKKLIIVGPDAADGALNGVVLNSDIVFKGVLKGDELANEYASADIFCLPSIEEGFGLVLGEAFSFGLPIIATCNTGVDDLIVDGQEGYIVPIRDIEALKDKMQILADDPGLLKILSANVKAKTGHLNGWAETGDILVKTLQEVNRNK